VNPGAPLRPVSGDDPAPCHRRLAGGGVRNARRAPGNREVKPTGRKNQWDPLRGHVGAMAGCGNLFANTTWMPA